MKEDKYLLVRADTNLEKSLSGIACGIVSRMPIEDYGSLIDELNKVLRSDWIIHFNNVDINLAEAKYKLEPVLFKNLESGRSSLYEILKVEKGLIRCKCVQNFNPTEVTFRRFEDIATVEDKIRVIQTLLRPGGVEKTEITS